MDAMKMDEVKTNVIKQVLEHWGFTNCDIIHRFDVSGSRLVERIRTENGDIILKGIPTNTDEKIIIGNTNAHLYLGNQKGLAPKLILLPDGNTYIKENGYYFYVMEFVSGRQLQETPEDEYLLGQATKKLHELTDYENLCSFDCETEKKVFYEWFQNLEFKNEFDKILDNLPDFSKYPQCFIHTDVGPHNALLNNDGKVVFVDLDDAGLGSKYIDLGWAFIMQFVDFNKETHEMKYRFDLAVAFLKGYYGETTITKDELDMIWSGAIYMHISYMQVYGPDAVWSLWQILQFGIDQKEKLFHML
ncbi:MAG: hypothetical protein K0S41_2947 [Anaerocolumna sp.]|jgi:Ser/Thr protein kinase RdoA (MazF antagonist)|nr:hypothetical protein [Anaerocolumna sp.]